MQEQSSLTLITKDNGKLTGERAEALPIKLITSNLGLKYLALGSIITIILFMTLIALANNQVAVIEVTGKSTNYNEYNLR